MKRKLLIALIAILSALCIGAGLIGFFQSKKGPSITDPEINKNKIKYVYYLDGVEVSKDKVSNKASVYDENTSSMIESDTNDVIFSNSSCTNNLAGTFDTEKWEFVPNEDKVSTCSLYFNKTNYEVTLTITNGELEPNQSEKVAREKNGIFKIKPYDGYEFDSVTCSNNKEATWDKDNNVLTINAITEDVACKVVFKLKTLTFKVKVENGTGDNTITTEYGKNISSIATPNSGFEYGNNAKITCTNNQTAKYSNNSIVIDKLTDNTDCTLKFSQVVVEKFKVSLTMPEHIKVNKGGTTQEVSKNSNAEFTLEAMTGYELVKMDCEGTEPAKTINSDGTVTYKISSVTKNMTCVVSEKTNTAANPTD